MWKWATLGVEGDGAARQRKEERKNMFKRLDAHAQTNPTDTSQLLQSPDKSWQIKCFYLFTICHEKSIYESRDSVH